MNVLKLLDCFWKLPSGKNEFKIVRYYVQYERENHSQNRVVENFGDFSYVSKHEDNYDKEIYKSLYESIEKIEDITEFHIVTYEILLFDEEEKRASFSNIANGYNFRDLQIKTLDNSVVGLATRLYFTDCNNESFRNLIFPIIPFELNLNLTGTIPTLIRANFLDRQRVNQILDRGNRHDFS